MKKIIKYGWQFFIPIVLYFPYLFANRTFLVNWFGCSCPKFDENHNLLANQFNTNDFTRIFWFVVSLIVFLISLIRSRTIVSIKNKLLYIGLSLLLASLFGFKLFLMSPSWK